ncbi:MAG: hypothetical protein U0984_12230 [Prosthecobacter sp.]|nr:hypothetical protein [Prosthecobacter sp.]
MKSQKQGNKAPRPFKSYNSDRWSGGGKGNNNYIPAAKPVVRPKKAGGAVGDKPSVSAAEEAATSETAP